MKKVMTVEELILYLKCKPRVVEIDWDGGYEMFFLGSNYSTEEWKRLRDEYGSLDILWFDYDSEADYLKIEV